MIGLCIFRTLLKLPAIFPGMVNFKILIKFGYKIIMKILWHSAVVVPRVSNNLAFFRNNFHHRTFIKSIQNYIRTIRFRKSKFKMSGSLGWSQLCRHIIIGEVDAIMMWLCDFSLMRKPGGSFIFLEF